MERQTAGSPVITAVVFFGFVVLRLACIAGIAYLLVPKGRHCPACGAETIPLQRTGLARAFPGIERRWCIACGWSWFRKRAAATPPGNRPADTRPRRTITTRTS